MSVLVRTAKTFAAAAHRYAMGRRAGFDGHLRRIKTRNKAIILGSGASIFDIAESDPAALSGYDIYAVNFSFLSGLPFHTIFYEPINTNYYNTVLLNILPTLSEKNVVINLRHYHDSRKNFVCPEPSAVQGYVPINLRTTDPALFEQWYGWVRFRLGIPLIVHHATHVFAVLDWTIMAGYESVIIAGVDLNGSPYFSDVERDWNGNPFAEWLEPYRDLRTRYERDMRYDPAFHPSNDPKLSQHHAMLKAEDAFRVVARLAERHPGRAPRIAVTDPASRLAAFFPVERP